MEGLITLEPQVFAGRLRPTAKRIKPAYNRPDFHWKPLGGLWTSSHTPDEEQASGWLEWCNGNNFGDERFAKAWLLQPKPSLVYVIRNRASLSDLLAQFAPRFPANFPQIGSLRETIDWEAFARQYDALWLPSPWELRLESMFIYGWDCESTFWARWCFESKVTKLSG